MFDSIVKCGLVFDGSGSPGIIQDIGISNGVIAALGEIERTAAQEVY